MTRVRRPGKPPARAPARGAMRLGRTLAMLAATAPALAGDVLFVSSFRGGQIVRFDLPAGSPTTIASGLSLPEDGTCNVARERVYFAESTNDSLRGWSFDGSVVEELLPAAGAVRGPEGISLDATGGLYINTRERFGVTHGVWLIPGSDPARGAVQVLPPFSGFGEGSAIVPAGPREGALLLVARAEREVYISDPPGSPAVPLLASASFPPLSRLFGVAANGCGEIFVTYASSMEGGPSGVLRFDSEGRFIDQYAQGFQQATFLEFDSWGNLYVADDAAGVVYRVTPDGTRAAFANVYSATGIAICRELWVPRCPAVTCDAGGDYRVECEGARTCAGLDGGASSDGLGRPLDFSWTSSCPGGAFDDPTSPTPELCVDTSAGVCGASCDVGLSVSNGVDVASCGSRLTVVDTTPPVVRDCGLTGDGSQGGTNGRRGCAGSKRGEFTVDCGVATDRCDPQVEVTARLVVVQVQGESCAATETPVEVACGEVVELAALPAACPGSGKELPDPVVVDADGHKVLTGHRIRVEVTGRDRCGLASEVCAAEAEMCPTPGPRCSVPTCP